MKTIPPKNNREFGFVMSAFFALLAFARLRHGVRLENIRLSFLSISILFFLAACAAPQSLRVLNRLWLNFGRLISKVTNPLIIGLFYFILFTPIAWILRLIGNDPLRFRHDSQLQSYWVPRNPLSDQFMQKPF